MALCPSLGLFLLEKFLIHLASKQEKGRLKGGQESSCLTSLKFYMYILPIKY